MEELGFDCKITSVGHPKAVAITRPRTPDVAAQQHMRPITDSARGMVNTVYDSLLNERK